MTDLTTLHENCKPAHLEPYPNDKPPIVPCGVPVLDNILTKIKPVEWAEVAKSLKEQKELYAVYVAEQILHATAGENTPLVEHVEILHYFTGTHYELVKDTKLNTFLTEAARQCNVPFDTALCCTFVQKVAKQILMSAARLNGDVSEPDTPYINVQNGTVFFDEDKSRFEKHSPQRLIRYCLGFNYDPKAKAPLWQEHLDRSIPNPEKQAYLAECLALPFYHGKIEKAAILHGQQNTGKSTTLDVYKALLGTQNCAAVPLAALTRSTDTGDYMRSMLNGKLVCIASDVGDAIADSGLAKTLISREMITVRNIDKKPYDMERYARLVFAMNKLPLAFFADPALTRRLAIILFDQQIEAAKVQTGFTEQIIANELAGVLNWLLGGLDRLLKKRRLDPPACCVAEMERMRVEVDPISSWLDERRYMKGDSEFVSVKGAYPDFAEFCKEIGLIGKAVPTKYAFTKQLRDMGYTVKSPNGHAGMQLYFSKANP